jgi:hypothetical protein
VPIDEFLLTPPEDAWLETVKGKKKTAVHAHPGSKVSELLM